MINIYEELLSEKKYKELITIHNHALNEVKGPIENMVEDFNTDAFYGRKVVHYHDFRLKDIDSLRKKLARKNCDISEISDIGGAKIVVLFEDDIPIIAERIENLFHVKETKDYLKKPKENGYRGIHKIITVKTVVNGRNMSAPIEIQIKTALMDALWSVEHVVRYKKENYDPKVTGIVLNAADSINNLEKDMIEARNF